MYRFERDDPVFFLYFGRLIVLNVVSFFGKKSHDSEKQNHGIFAIRLSFFSSLLQIHLFVIF